MKTFINLPNERIKLLKKSEKWKEKLKNYFPSVKIEIVDNSISLEGENSIEVYTLKQIFLAFGRGFDLETALNLADENFRLEIIDVSEFATSPNRQKVLKGRVIGEKGKAKRLIEEFTSTKISVYGKTISIIGRIENVEIAKKAVVMLLSGAMHRTVYRFLERQRSFLNFKSI